MLVSFLFSVYPRSMDSLCSNTGLVNYDAQIAFVKAAAERLANPSVLQVEGWRLIPAIPKLYKAMNLDMDYLTLTMQPARHPSSPSELVCFDEILLQGGTLICWVSQVTEIIFMV